ncbi:MAG: hypothetical protein Q9161_008468 [Pseudevernia consocians]
MSVAMLEPAPKGKDSYNRHREEGQAPVFDQEEPQVKDAYEIEKLVNRRVSRPRGRGSKEKNEIVEYLVKWKNWGKAHNAWYKVEDLQGLDARLRRQVWEAIAEAIPKTEEDLGCLKVFQTSPGIAVTPPELTFSLKCELGRLIDQIHSTDDVDDVMKHVQRLFDPARGQQEQAEGLGDRQKDAVCK